MANIIEMPKLSDTMTVGTLAKWLKKEGDVVKEGAPLYRIEPDLFEAALRLGIAMTLLQFAIGALNDLVDRHGDASAYRNHAEIASSPNFDPDSIPGNNSTSEDDNASAGPVISDLSLGKTLAREVPGREHLFIERTWRRADAEYHYRMPGAVRRAVTQAYG